MCELRAAVGSQLFCVIGWRRYRMPHTVGSRELSVIDCLGEKSEDFPFTNPRPSQHCRLSYRLRVINHPNCMGNPGCGPEISDRSGHLNKPRRPGAETTGILEAGHPRSKCQQVGFGEDFLPGLWTALPWPFFCAYMKRERALVSLALHVRTPVLLDQGPTLMTSFNFTSLKALYPNRVMGVRA